MTTIIESKEWGKLKEDKIFLYTFQSNTGLNVSVTNYGATIVSMIVHKSNQMIDVALGFDTLEGYLQDHPYLGATVGRYANRIAGGKFVLDGKNYELEKNNGDNSLHGGFNGFSHRSWKSKIINGKFVQMELISKDGDQGFPGCLRIIKEFHVIGNRIEMIYKAQTDQKTIINLTDHSYFNLNGQGSGNIYNHHLKIYARQYTPLNKNQIPTGFLETVEGSPFDFMEGKKIGKDINLDNGQLKIGSGYDHNFVLEKGNERCQIAAEATGDLTGICLKVYTTEPGIQLYTANFLAGLIGKSGKKHSNRDAFCLESQHFPDSPNQSGFPSTILEPSEEFYSKTIYEFS